MAEKEKGKEEALAQAENNQPQFALQRIYLKDMSFESPDAPDVFRGKWEPKVQLDVNTSAKVLQEDLYDVVLSVTVTVHNNDKVAYLVEVKQAGIFVLKNITEDVKRQALGALCPSSLFPYAREAIDNMATRGSFPPLHLAPINFDALYAEAQKRDADKAVAGATH